MARPKTPTNILDMKGAYKKHPERARKNEPKPKEGAGPPPRHFDADHKKIWRELVKVCAPGVLSRQDRAALEIIVMGLYQVRNGVKAQDPDTQEIVTLPAPSPLCDRVFKQLGKFGMTPSERSNVVVPGEKPADKKFGGL